MIVMGMDGGDLYNQNALDMALHGPVDGMINGCSVPEHWPQYEHFFRSSHVPRRLATFQDLTIQPSGNLLKESMTAFYPRLASK